MRTILLLALAAACLPATATANDDASRDARMKWWREARFGMFVHWGLYSGLAGTWDGRKVGDRGGMEWIQQRVGVDTKTYAEKAIPLFRPKAGFAKEWAHLAKEAGCQYVVFTTKHHEGFALHDSKVTDYDAMDVTGRDLVREIVDALRAEGLKVGFYHSLIDWHHPDYDFRAAQELPYPKGAAAAATAPRDHGRYLEFLHAQVTELTSNYGPVDVMWWDYSSTKFQGDAAWKATDLMAKVRARQPNIIMNNRLFRIPEAGFNGMGTSAISNRMDPKYGDFITPEQHIPATGIPGVDWETCMTMNTTWGFSEHDQAWKTPETMVRNLIDIASKGGNYLLNIGPKGDGSIPRESIEAMQAFGKWMDSNNESIRATTASPFEKLSFEGRATAKGNVVYLHVFQRPADGKLVVPAKGAKATLLASGAALACTREGGNLVIDLPPALPDPVATVIKVEP